MKTKIIATIGPSSYDKKTLKRMQKNGMSIARLNTKHISKKKFEKIYPLIKKLRNVEILIDINTTKVFDWINEFDYGFLAISFATSASQIKKIKKLANKDVKIISKIENEKGVENFKNILKESHGIMIARGDLAKNIPFEKIPAIQKIIIKECNKRRKISITATEMLTSLVHSKSPENSEVSDIANAVTNGSKAVMLSEETAIGKYPSLAVKIMAKVIKETEKEMSIK